MAGQAAKKAAQRKRQVWIIYGSIAAISNLLFFLLRFYFHYSPFTTYGWLSILFLEATIGFSFYSLLSAAENDTVSDSGLDMFAVAVVSQLGSLYSDRFWYILFLVPILFIVQVVIPMFNSVQNIVSNVVPTQSENGEDKIKDDIMEAKRARRKAHKEKLMARQ
jgi:SRP-independent targeting protein 2/TMEM208